MYLHDDEAAFRAAVLSCADSLGMSPSFVTATALSEISAWLRESGI